MRVLVNMQEMDLPFQQTGLNTTQKFIAKNPDIVRRVVKSVIEATHMMRNNPAVAKRAIGSACNQGMRKSRRMPINC